jgi:hypothetical protein
MADISCRAWNDVYSTRSRLTGLCLTRIVPIPSCFASQKAESLGQVPESVGDEATRKRALVLRRSMLLAVAGGTPPDSPSLSQALSGGYLNSVKKWLEDVLVGSVGTYDNESSLPGS